jgi:hypothetical protein
MRNDLAEDPAVIRVAGELGIDEFSVVGRLHRLWSWADRQTLDGHAVGVTFVTLDRILSCDGFCAALQRAGWLSAEQPGDDGQPASVVIPNFDRYNGEPAKKRALATRRKAKQRSSSVTDSGQMSRSERDKSVTREEKRRDIDIDSLRSSISSAHEEKPKKPKRGSRTVPEVFALDDDLREWSSAILGNRVDAELAKFRDHQFATPKTDWTRTWRNWCRTAAERLPTAKQSAGPSAASDFGELRSTLAPKTAGGDA